MSQSVFISRLLSTGNSKPSRRSRILSRIRSVRKEVVDVIHSLHCLPLTMDDDRAPYIPSSSPLPLIASTPRPDRVGRAARAASAAPPASPILHSPRLLREPCFDWANTGFNDGSFNDEETILFDVTQTGELPQLNRTFTVVADSAPSDERPLLQLQTLPPTVVFRVPTAQSARSLSTSTIDIEEIHEDNEEVEV